MQKTKITFKLLCFIYFILLLATPFFTNFIVESILYTPYEYGGIIGITNWGGAIRGIGIIVLLNSFSFLINYLINIIRKRINIKKENYLPSIVFFTITTIIPTIIAVFRYFVYYYPDYNHWLFN